MKIVFISSCREGGEDHTTKLFFNNNVVDCLVDDQQYLKLTKDIWPGINELVVFSTFRDWSFKLDRISHEKNINSSRMFGNSTLLTQNFIALFNIVYVLSEIPDNMHFEVIEKYFNKEHKVVDGFGNRLYLFKINDNQIIDVQDELFKKNKLNKLVVEVDDKTLETFYKPYNVPIHKIGELSEDAQVTWSGIKRKFYEQ